MEGWETKATIGMKAKSLTAKPWGDSQAAFVGWKKKVYKKGKDIKEYNLWKAEVKSNAFCPAVCLNPVQKLLLGKTSTNEGNDGSFNSVWSM